MSMNSLVGKVNVTVFLNWRYIMQKLIIYLAYPKRILSLKGFDEDNKTLDGVSWVLFISLIIYLCIQHFSIVARDLRNFSQDATLFHEESDQTIPLFSVLSLIKVNLDQVSAQNHLFLFFLLGRKVSAMIKVSKVGRKFETITTHIRRSHSTRQKPIS